MDFEIDFNNLKQMDLHMHTTFSDGAVTPAEMVSAAIAKGLKVVGISDHSYLKIDESCCMPKACAGQYKKEVNSLKNRKDITVYCGIEQDSFSEVSTDGYDYVIGSVHFVSPAEGVYFSVDDTIEILKDGCDKYFNGDMISVCQEYFRTVSLFAERKDVDIIGHFDVVSKFNENDGIYDSHDPRYIKAWQDAVDKLIQSGHTLFEINTGAMAKGYRTAPYPSVEMIDYIKSKGGKFVFSSDAHVPENIAFGFDRVQMHLEKITN